ncbi:preprotein translocase subunit YajC [Nocardioides sp. JQ2195]|nr:preprotein translocase subunit YajC [Nocardioides sp. JQ2195]
MLSLLPIIAIFLIFWLLVIRPASRRQKEMRQVQQELQVGDEIITNSGIFGTVARLEDDKLGIEIANGLVVMMARGAVAGVVPAAGRVELEDADLPETTDQDAPETREQEK